jgi:arginine deiminase
LREIGETAAVGDQALLGMGEHIDEARRHRLAARIDFRAAASVEMRRNGGDTIAVHRDVGHIGCSARTVIDGAVADDDIVNGRSTRAVRGRKSKK